MPTPSKIIREALVHGDTAHCVIRSNHYGASLRFIHELATAAREDFPALTDEAIEVVKFGGIRIKKTMGIEFKVPAAGLPESYARLHALEYHLA